MAKNKEGFEKDLNIEADDLLTHIAKQRQAAKKPKLKKAKVKEKSGE